MRFIVGVLISITFLFGADATIEVSKKADSLSSIAVEDASVNYRDGVSKRFFQAMVSDLNVLSLFNVDRKYSTTHFNDEGVNEINANADYVLRYKLEEDDNGAFLAEIKLIRSGSVELSKRYRISKSEKYIFIVHAIAYDINDAMGGAPVDWMKRKVVLSRLVAPGKSEILLTDYTLTYQHVIIRGGLKVFPKWADDAQSSFYFTDLDGRKPTLYKMDTRTGKRERIISSDGMMICSDVRDDGQKLLLTMAPQGQPDIYLMDANTRKYSRVTKYKGIDVNGEFMEENRIAFISNRLGYPNVFSKRIGSSSVEQMVYYGKSNSSCTTHKDYIVYKARESSHAFSRNTFNLHLISTKTDFIRRLTATGVNEFPRFSRDGDAILFIKNYKQQSAIGVIRLEHNKNYLFPLSIGKIQSLDW
ncbi:MAG: Tol-Pal system protein TolB [Campylobacterota bacterium]|nr:Tol-Pal system protein TolB [Campylobacterota bacterium]